jgi:hypothetical protein
VALPSLPDALGVLGPVFLRRIPKQSDWGDPSDPLDVRVANAVQTGFLKRDNSPFSFYWIQTADQLRRVALALNATTRKKTQKVDLVAFLPEDFEAARIAGDQTRGETPCSFANKLHVDFEATPAQLEILCRHAMQAGRRAHRYNERQMEEILSLAQQEQCHSAVDNSPGCNVEAC